MSRLMNLRSQVDDLKQEKDRLEAENAHLKETLQAEVDRLREENERLQEESDATAARGEMRLEEERSETEKLLEEQRQLYEDLQAELAEAVERGTSLEDRCSSLEDKMLQMIEESQVERLKAVDAISTKYEETLLPQMQELQQQVWKLQESQSRTTVPVLLLRKTLLNLISSYLRKPLAQKRVQGGQTPTRPQAPHRLPPLQQLILNHITLATKLRP